MHKKNGRTFSCINIDAGRWRILNMWRLNDILWRMERQRYNSKAAAENLLVKKREAALWGNRYRK